MIQTKAFVVQHAPVAQDHFLMRLKAPQVARKALAGQFKKAGAEATEWVKEIRLKKDDPANVSQIPVRFFQRSPLNLSGLIF